MQAKDVEQPSGSVQMVGELHATTHVCSTVRDQNAIHRLLAAQAPEEGPALTRSTRFSFRYCPARHQPSTPFIRRSGS